MEYRRKRERVEAFQYLGKENSESTPSWLKEKILRESKNTGKLVITGDRIAYIGDYVIRKESGEILVMTQEQFKAIYVEEEPVCNCPDEVKIKKYGPIEEFETPEQLEECLRWWQHKLYLDSWLIVAHTTNEIIDKDGSRMCCTEGLNIFEHESSQSSIQIITKETHDDERMIFKYCAEKILVHELLHCKYAWMDNQTAYESVYLCSKEHQLLEEMARTLVMAKYNLDYGYFMEG